MNNELKGVGSNIVGGTYYFRKLKENYYFSKVMQSDSMNFRNAVEILCNRVVDTLREINDDLEKNAAMLRYSNSEKRKTLEKYVESLDKLVSYYLGKTTKKYEINSLLTLSNKRTIIISGVKESELKSVYDFLSSNPYFSKLTSFDLFKKAMNGSISYAVGNDEKKAGFFNSLTKKVSKFDKCFYVDFETYAKSKESFFKVVGKNGKELCSNEYINYFEEKIFGTKIMNYSYQGHLDYIKDKLSKIKETIQKDVYSGINTNKYIIYRNRENIKSVYKELEKVKVRVSSEDNNNVGKLRRLEDFDNSVILIEKSNQSTPVTADLVFENGKNILKIYARVTLFTSNETHKTAILDGFKMWAGDYKVFNDQQLKVTVEITEVNEDKKVGPILDTIFGNSVKVIITDIPGQRSLAFGGGDSTGLWGWGSETDAPKIMLLNVSEEGSKKVIDEDLAKHEFGHILGVGDAYQDEGLGLKGVKPGNFDIDPYYIPNKDEEDKTYEYNMVMDNNGQITNNDIEMVVRAFQTGERQNYQTQDLTLAEFAESTFNLTLKPQTGIKLFDEILPNLKVSKITKVSDVLGRGN